MEIIKRIATANTPYIDFNAETGKMIISGRLIPQPDDDFWSPLLKWFYAYSSAPHSITELFLEIEYFNTFSSKQILFLLHKMDELFEQGHQVSIIWKYDIYDEEMKEAGHDFSSFVNVPFKFITTNEMVYIQNY